jgi:hypothetical protein
MKPEILEALRERLEHKDIKSGLGIGLVVTKQLLDLMVSEISTKILRNFTEFSLKDSRLF